MALNRPREEWKCDSLSVCKPRKRFYILTPYFLNNGVETQNGSRFSLRWVPKYKCVLKNRDPRVRE